MNQRILNLNLGEAARLKVFGRDGEEYVTSFGTPGANTIPLPDGGDFEQAYVNIEPLAGTPWTQTVDFQGLAVASVRGERPAPQEPAISTRSAPPSTGTAPLLISPNSTTSSNFAGPGRDNGVPPPSATPSSAPALAPFFWVGAGSAPVVAHSDSVATAVRPSALPQPRQRRFSLGLSTDAKPFDYGGWRPFHGPWSVRVNEVDNRLRIEVPREDSYDVVPPEDGSRIRVTLAAEHAFVERFLLPIYSGGVRIDLVAASAAFGPRCHVRPLDPDRYALQQALEAGSEEEGGIIWSKFSAQHDIEQYVRSDSISDPWTVLLVLLVHDRFRSVSLSHPERWCDLMASRFSWVSDFFILQAHYAFRSDSAPSLERSGSRNALQLLSHARRIGAPYFAGTNQMLFRLLSSLADWDSGSETAKEAQAEMGRWWRLLDNQSTNGVLLAWRADKGARTHGVLNEKYTKTIAQGTIANGVVRQLPVEATVFSNHRVAVAPVARTRNR
jgi:hypothetical protein